MFIHPNGYMCIINNHTSPLVIDTPLVDDPFRRFLTPPPLMMTRLPCQRQGGYINTPKLYFIRITNLFPTYKLHFPVGHAAVTKQRLHSDGAGGPQPYRRPCLDRPQPRDGARLYSFRRTPIVGLKQW
jgi:hypothetical protein